jgi:YidC/Oxa1 family membrane protein insertase
LAKAQMDLYKTEGVNPVGGCLPQILQIAVLIVFFQAFNMVVGYSEGKTKLADLNRELIPSYQIKEDFKFEPNFFGSDLRNTPSKEFANGMGMNLLLPILVLVGSGVTQYFSAKLMMPNVEVDKKIVAETKDKEDDMMSAMRTQSTYMMPLMTVFLGWNFSLGILLYWFVNSGVMLIQQIVVAKLDKKPAGNMLK